VSIDVDARLISTRGHAEIQANFALPLNCWEAGMMPDAACQHVS